MNVMGLEARAQVPVPLWAMLPGQQRKKTEVFPMGSEMPLNGEDVCWIRRYTFS